MRAIITRANADGSFDDVGMNNRTVTGRGQYKSLKSILRYGIPKHFKGKIRIELFSGDSIYGDSYLTTYTNR